MGGIWGVFVLITFQVQTFSLVIEFLSIFMKSRMKTKRKQENLISYNKVLLLVPYKCKIMGPWTPEGICRNKKNKIKP